MAKQKSTDKSAKPVPPATLARLTLRLSLTLGATLWLGIALVLVYLQAIWYPEYRSQTLQTLSEGYAAQQLGAVEQFAQGRQEQLAGLAQSVHLHDVLGDDLDNFRTDLEQDLIRQFPGAVSFRIIPLDHLGVAGLSRRNISLRNNIETDMVRRAANLESVAPEAYQHEKHWLISFTQAVTDTLDSQKVVGAVVLTMDLQPLQQALNRLPGNAGKTALASQVTANAPFISVGISADKTPTTTLKSTVLPWQLSFTAGDQTLASTEASLLTISITLGLMALILPGLIWFLLRLQQSRISGDLTRLDHYLENWQKVNTPDLPRFDIAEVENIASKLSSASRGFIPPQAVEPLDGLSTNTPLTHLGTTPKTSLPDPMDLSPLDSLDDILDVEDLGSSGMTLEALSLPNISPGIFRAYDIRGHADLELSNETCQQLGLAIGSMAIDQGQRKIVVGYDGRHSSPRIRNHLVLGLLESGCDVIDIGVVPTPLVYFATHHLTTQSGVMITGSHNPSEYNGMKIVIAGRTLLGEDIQALAHRIQTQSFHHGVGLEETTDLQQDYIDTVIGDVAIAQPLKVVVDCGNGAAGRLAPLLLQELGCEVIPLFCDIDGSFPNHHPDPSVLENLSDLINAVKEHRADLGIALDGDGDRIGVVTSSGAIVLPDRLLMLFAQDVVSRNPGTDVIFDVKCTRHLNQLISSYGGRPIMWKSGHSNIKEKMQETGALLGGELSGHVFFKERWFGFDDGMYSAARLIEILSTTDANLDNQMAQFPRSLSTPELHVTIDEHKKFAFMDLLQAKAQFGDAKINHLDGIRADFPDGWGLVRASNTTPVLTLRFEAESPAALLRIQALFKEQIAALDNTLVFSF